MNLGDYDLGDDVVFYVQAVDTAGSVSNATAGPTYDVYEDEAAPAVASGNMVQLGGEVGFYAETITVAGPTYQVGSVYAIRVEATVDGEDPGVVLFFRIRSQTLLQTVIDGITASLAAIREAVWKRVQPANPDADAMEDIKTGVDDLEFTGREG